ncbi:TonB-dependent siderophore receptor [Colwellia sp. 4_MG-2023]|uniref:TonB-dependent siderophore receptor n=1 Tax=unclassified Colwellia TaxID=196834 RepID=UPI0026E1C899|nr:MULTISPECIES: TonB-dependent siderophore receptor [unclassified Colwellia]MDO6507111.1 TonB-dependent siderophore receptor [Colwellia sp. 5_MG-2023]MDO6555947.1 TonB-dependent siderophore receptor [Colwellia sp. 4_MG-2023]
MKFQLGYLAVLVALSSNAQETNNLAKDDVSDIEKITVTGTNQKRYIVENTDSLTGFPVDFLDMPRVVNIVPEQVILDQKITDLSEALRNSPGISLGDGFGGTNDDFLIRGFRRNTVYRNGFRRATNFKTNLSNIEYTQVVRGPASITYGQVEPGGLVDVITKKPLFESRISGEARLGSFDDKFFLFDVSQSISERVGVRVVASTQDAESFRDFTDISRDTISISSVIDFTKSTSLDLSYEYRDESRPLDRGTITVPTANGREVINELLDIPNSRRFGEEYEIFESKFNFAEATLNHEFNDNWTLKVSGAIESSSANDLQARPVALAIFDADGPITEDGYIIFQDPSEIATILGTATTRTIFDDPTDQVFLLRRTDGSQEQDVEVFYANLLLTGEVKLGNTNHRLATGADYRYGDTTRYFVDTPYTNGVSEAIGGDGALFNVSNPIYGNLVDSLSIEGVPLITVIEKNTGVFVNDYIEVTDKFNILAGLRYDSFEIGGDLPVDEADQFSPQLAANYNLTETMSMFVSYSTAFEPNTATNTLTGKTEAFDPEDSTQYELGFKAEFFDGNLQTSIAIYDIDKNNILSADENDLPILIEGQSSQGGEISISGQPTEGMNIIAGYAYVDAEIGTGNNSSNRPRNVAENTFNLWTSYEVQGGTFEGLGLGAGAFYVGDRYGDDNNSYKLDAYTVVDLSAWYTLNVKKLGANDTLRFQLALKNVLDEEYYSASGGDLRISIGSPRTVFGSVSFDF